MRGAFSEARESLLVCGGAQTRERAGTACSAPQASGERGRRVRALKVDSLGPARLELEQL